ncbi:MAG: HD domain-containing protein [Chloroflexota bacterium]
MLIHDSVYGAVEITEPVIYDLISSAAMGRLHGVLQHGVSALIGVTNPTTRFEHSLGTMLLVRRLGAGLDEQIAALLHDISHTAFSHVIDYVFDGHDDQNYHDQHKVAYVRGTDIPDVLGLYGLDWLDYMAEDSFPLLEQPSPHLCADRLDYFLRDSRDLGLADDADIESVLAHLTVEGNRIVVNHLETARWLGYTFIEADKASWANFREVGLYELAARAIRRGLAIGVLTDADLWGTDLPAWEKLQSSRDSKLQHNLQRVKANTRFVWDDGNPEFRVSTKLRSIDPDLLLNGQVKPLSTLDPDFASVRGAYLTGQRGKWPMRVIAEGNDD